MAIHAMVYFPEGVFKNILEYCDTQEREEAYALEQHKKTWQFIRVLCRQKGWSCCTDGNDRSHSLISNLPMTTYRFSRYIPKGAPWNDMYSPKSWRGRWLTVNANDPIFKWNGSVSSTCT